MAQLEIRLGDGKFRVGDKVGSGAFGDIYAGVNLETGEEVAVDTGRVALRRRYRSGAADEERALRTLFRRLAVDEIEVRTDTSYVGPLLTFFRSRERKRSR